MSDTEERTAAAKELGDRLGFRLIDDSDWICDDDGRRVSAHNAYWFVLSGHSDERLDQPIRHGQWPRTAEVAIQRLWHRCVALSVERATTTRLHANKHLKLSAIACGLIMAALTIPLLCGRLHLVNRHQVNVLWHYGNYLAAVALGALIASWWTRF